MTIEVPLDERLQELRAILLNRHEKYGPRNVADAPGGALNGLRVRMHDKLARINNWIDNKTQADFDDDKLRDAFIDLANYAVIGLMVLDEVWPDGEPVLREPTVRDRYGYLWRWGTYNGRTGYRWHRPSLGGDTEMASQVSTHTLLSLDEQFGPLTEVNE